MERSFPEKVRVKVWRVLGEGGSAELGDDLLEIFPGFREALEEADRNAEARAKELQSNYGIQPREDWAWTLPEPAIIELEREEVNRLSEALKTSLDQQAATINYRGKTYRLTLEYPCG